MREILFRGKPLQNPKLPFIYGSLIVFNDCYSIKEDKPFAFADAINPETLTQYTGIKDKNGVRVFEGDILKIYQKSDALGYYPEVPYPRNVIVKWGLCAWVWETITQYKRHILFPDAWCHCYCEVIGNIYDNPELLKEDKNDKRKRTRKTRRHRLDG